MHYIIPYFLCIIIPLPFLYKSVFLISQNKKGAGTKYLCFFQLQFKKKRFSIVLYTALCTPQLIQGAAVYRQGIPRQGA